MSNQWPPGGWQPPQGGYPGGQGPPGYGYPGYPPGPPPTYGTSSKAITSLVLGILSWFTCGLLLSIPAVIAGHLARDELDRAAGRLEGRGMAVAGLILGYLNILACVVAIALVIAAIASDSSGASLPVPTGALLAG